MFGWSKKRKARVYCPKCKFKFTLSYDKDAVFEPYEYYLETGKKLTTTICPSCKIELCIILIESRMFWEKKHLALDIEFEKEEKKLLEDNFPWLTGN